MQPAFEKEKFEIARNNTCQGLRQLPDNPQNLAFREYKKCCMPEIPAAHCLRLLL
jgi:predicted Zn-dependent peptidase